MKLLQILILKISLNILVALNNSLKELDKKDIKYFK